MPGSGFLPPKLAEFMEWKAKTTKDTSTNFCKKGIHSLKIRVLLMQQNKINTSDETSVKSYAHSLL